MTNPATTRRDAIELQTRITGRTLQRKREQLFRRNPLCVGCLAKVPPITRLWTQRDHIVPLHQGGVDDETNEQGLCDECHLEKSKRERGHEYKPKRIIGADGYPVKTIVADDDASRGRGE